MRVVNAQGDYAQGEDHRDQREIGGDYQLETHRSYLDVSGFWHASSACLGSTNWRRLLMDAAGSHERQGQGSDKAKRLHHFPRCESVSGVFLTVRKPPAPDYLADPEQTEWRAIVGCMPSDWFPRESHPALAALCRHACRSRVLAAQCTKIEATCIKTEEGLRVLDRLLGLLERGTRAVMALSCSMRLTQQTRIDKGAAGRRTDGPRPSYYDSAEANQDVGCGSP